MTLSDPESSIQLKVHFADGMLDIRILCFHSQPCLTDTVDMTSASLYGCTTGVVFSQLHDQLVSLERRAVAVSLW